MKMHALVAAVATAILGVGGLTVAAQATGGGGDEPCVPSDAWTETVEHPEVTEVVHHEAVVHSEWRYAKFTHTKTREKHGDWSDYGPWTIWGSGHEHESWETQNVEALNAPAFHGSGKDGKTEWYREWQIRNTGETRQVEDQAAYDETVVVEEAWTETIEHPAVVCETEPPTEPPTTEPTEPPTTEPTEPPTTEPTEPPTTEPPGLIPPVRSFVVHTCEYNTRHDQEFVDGAWQDSHVEHVATGRDCSGSGQPLVEEEGM